MATDKKCIFINSSKVITVEGGVLDWGGVWKMWAGWSATVHSGSAPSPELRRPWPAGEQTQEVPPGSEQVLQQHGLIPAAAASCAYLRSRKAFILLHMLDAALARAHLEQGIQFGSPPFGRDSKRLETVNGEECRRWQGEGAQTACSAV